LKKKHAEFAQLNTASAWKVIIFVLCVVVIEVAMAIFTYNQFATRTYRQALAQSTDSATTLATSLNEGYSCEISDLENSTSLSSVYDACERSERFGFYVIFSSANEGRVLFSGNTVLIASDGSLKDYGITFSKTSTIKLADGKEYVFSSAKLGNGTYYIGGVSDFSESRKNIDNLLGNVVAGLVVAGILIALTFAAFAYVYNKREAEHYFKYKVKLDGKGRVVHSNAAYKKTFNSTRLTTDKLDKKDFTLVNLTTLEGDKLVAVRKVDFGGKTKIFAGDVSNSESFLQSEEESGILDSQGRTTVSLSKVFEGFVAKGKRTLLGIMYITKLDQIKTLFGKQMAVDIQKIILKKVREKFTYAYELDFAYIGVTYPDGKKLNNLMSDLEDIYRYINSPIKVDDNLFTIEIKSGFAMCDASMEPLNFEHAFKAAEAAKQRVLDTKIADYIVYHESQKKLYAKYFIKFDIKQMLSEGAFEMEYQPQYNIKEERIEGFEALFRVKKSWNVNVDTFSFITYAERTGAMVQLGDFIFDTGMQFAKGLEGKNVSVSLNVSPVQLMQAGFIENFLRIYKKYDLKSGSICVEITESFLMTNFDETLKKLAILTQNGINVHLDDFGTEYSSLLYIKTLPISTIKIDKEFVKDILTSRESQSVVKFITNIARLLNRTTICEGVETPQEFDMLNFLGCDTIQGWLISKSLKPDAAMQIVDTFDYRAVVEKYNQKNGQ